MYRKRSIETCAPSRDGRKANRRIVLTGDTRSQCTPYKRDHEAHTAGIGVVCVKGSVCGASRLWYGEEVDTTADCYAWPMSKYGL